MGEEAASLLDVEEEAASLLDVGEEAASYLDVGEKVASFLEVGENAASLIGVREKAASFLNVGKKVTSFLDVGREAAYLLDVGEGESFICARCLLFRGRVLSEHGRVGKRQRVRDGDGALPLAFLLGGGSGVVSCLLCLLGLGPLLCGSAELLLGEGIAPDRLDPLIFAHVARGRGRALGWGWSGFLAARLLV